MSSRNRYYVHDRASTQCSDLAQWSHLHPRFVIVDRETGTPVDDASSRYAARSAAQGWNAGVYTSTSTTTIERTSIVEIFATINGVGARYLVASVTTTDELLVISETDGPTLALSLVATHSSYVDALRDATAHAVAEVESELRA